MGLPINELKNVIKNLVEIVKNESLQSSNVIKVFEPIQPGVSKSVFLAGPTYRINDDNCYIPKSWRDDAISIFKDLKFDGIIYSPEWINNVKPNDWTYDKQVEWEVAALNAADIILFWIPRDMKDLPALTTNIEFGEWMHSGKIIVGAPSDAEKMDYIKSRCNLNEDKIPFIDNLEDLIELAIDMCESKNNLEGNVWFTSDTHFTQQRTLELSKRPFQNVFHMDEQLIRNWNSVVRDTDTVYHLGDFGDIGTIEKIISQLNGKVINIIPGNYDNDEVLNKLKTDNRVNIIPQGTIVHYNGIDIRLVHEPENMVGDVFHLFGHVHQLQMVKTNSLNVGSDCHKNKPISIDTVMFYHNAITKFYDKNVFDDFLK